MSYNNKRRAAISVFAVLAAGAMALGASASASASTPTAEQGLTKMAVQGDRLQGPFTTKTNIQVGGSANNYFWTNWNGAGPAGGATVGGDTVKGPLNVATPPTFTQPVEIWTFPAVGTTGPVMNAAGQCMQAGNPTSSGLVGNITLATCNGSAAQQWLLDDRGRLSMTKQFGGSSYTAFFTDQWTGVEGRVGSQTDAAGGQSAEAIHLPGLIPEPVDCTDGLTGVIENIDHEAKSAAVSGTGKPGETITITGSPTGPVNVVVPANGSWSTTISGLAVGDNALTITSSDNCTPIPLSVIVQPLEIPLVHPLAAASVLFLGLGGVGFGIHRRRSAAQA